VRKEQGLVSATPELFFSPSYETATVRKKDYLVGKHDSLAEMVLSERGKIELDPNAIFRKRCRNKKKPT